MNSAHRDESSRLPTAEFGRQPERGGSDAEALVFRLIADMTRRWRQGERPVAEEYLTNYPELSESPEAAVELIYEEICLRQQNGEPPAATPLLKRFPQWRPQLQVILECHRIFEPEAPQFPTTGDSLGDFRLLAELGRGGHGRTYLAAEQSLGERPMVLKCVPISSGEHLSLARLQHTNIVPLYAVEEDSARRLRILCMPYFGGATLARLLELQRTTPAKMRTGNQWVAALDAAQPAAPSKTSLPIDGAARQFLAGASYVDAICWMGAHLADALQYAHDRGLVHLDLKPSNILWAADGQPMLLDFHLARAPIPAGVRSPDWLGGTPGYMAPEMLLAFEAVARNQPIAEPLDGRTDVYGLGIVLYEALGGDLRAAKESPGRSLRRSNPQVSLGLADMVEKCLTAKAERRYQHAGHLADDLRRHLAHQALHGVGNRSIGERWSKWRRRRPYDVALIGLALLAFGVGGIWLFHAYHQYQQATDALRLGQGHLRQQRYGEAHSALQNGLTLLDGVPFSRRLADELRADLERTERVEAIQELHGFVDRLRDLYGADEINYKEYREIEGFSRRMWPRRQALLERSEQSEGENWRQQMRDDLFDLAILWTGLRVRMANRSQEALQRQYALQILEQAETLLGVNGALLWERKIHAEMLRLDNVAQAAAKQAAGLTARTAWEHLALGRALLQIDDYADAGEHLQKAVDLHPRDFWPNFYLGKSMARRQKHDEAITAFTVCVALAPDKADCFHNRALAYAASGRQQRALEDFDRALLLDPDQGTIAFDRGLLYYQLKNYAQALADFRSALQHGANPAAVHYQIALIHMANKERDAALASLRQALESDPNHQPSRTLQSKLLQEE